MFDTIEYKKGILQKLTHEGFDTTTLLILGYRGSVAHGTYDDINAIDDVDIMGVSIPPIHNFFGLSKFEQFERSGELDTVIYEFRKYIRLLIKSNPNVMSLMWLEPKHYIYVSELGNRLLYNRDMFSSQRAYYAFKGYAHNQLKRMTAFKKYSGYMGKKRKALVDKYKFDCYVEETEFLTNNGWKLYDEIDAKDLLATVDKKTHKLMFQFPLDKVKKKYTGDVFIIENRYSRCAVTPNHRMFISNVHRNPKNNYSTKYNKNISNWRFESVQNLVNSYRSNYHILTTPSPNTDEFEIEDTYLSLIGFYVSDGTAQFRNNKLKYIRLSQTPKGKKEFFEIADKLSSKYGFKKYAYFRQERGYDETIWMTHDKIKQKLYADCGHGKTKHLPNYIYKLSKRQADILLHALILGDGTAKKDYADVYYSYNKTIADGVQTLALIAGRNSNVYFYPQHKGCYQVYIRRNLSCPSAITMNPTIKKTVKNKIKGGFKIPYNGNIVCFTVPNEILITRLNGKVAIQGNTKNASHLIRLLKMCKEFLETGKLNVWREDARVLLDIKRGKLKLEEVIKLAKLLEAQCDTALMSTKLPKKPDEEKIEKFVVNTIILHFKERYAVHQK